MFTGIIEEIGTIKSFTKISHGIQLVIGCSKILEDINIGDSICVNGVCQTVIDFSDNCFVTQLSEETLSVTNFSNVKLADEVNLERALTLSTRLGGHIVTGHIDTMADVVGLEKLTDFYNLSIELKDEIKKYVVKKGSISINGISLTVADVFMDKFTCAIIPHTFLNTILRNLKIGAKVNLEADLFAKYSESILLNKQKEAKKSVITEEFLMENGFV